MSEFRKLWDQDRFNNDHKEPVEYGEGDYTIIGNQYTDQEAADKINAFIEMLTGDPATYTADDISPMAMYVNDKNDDGEDWWYVHNVSDEKPFALGKGVSE